MIGFLDHKKGNFGGSVFNQALLKGGGPPRGGPPRGPPGGPPQPEKQTLLASSLKDALIMPVYSTLFSFKFMLLFFFRLEPTILKNIMLKSNVELSLLV